MMSTVKDLSVEELVAKIQEEKKALANYKLNHAVSPLENPTVIKNTRRSIAQLQTELSSKRNAK